MARKSNKITIPITNGFSLDPDDVIGEVVLTGEPNVKELLATVDKFHIEPQYTKTTAGKTKATMFSFVPKPVTNEVANAKRRLKIDFINSLSQTIKIVIFLELVFGLVAIGLWAGGRL